MSNLTTEQVVIGLKNGELKYVEKEKKSSNSSEVWTSFNEIVDMQEQSIGFVICKNCEHIFKYNYKTGTSTLKRHKCQYDEKQSKITSFWTGKNFSQLLKM